MKENTNSKYTSLSDEDYHILELLEENKQKLHFMYRQFFFIFTLCFLIDLTLIIYMFGVVKKLSFMHTIVLIFIVALSVIFLFFSTIIVIIRLWLDRKRLIAKIIERFSNNYVIAYFFNASQRVNSQLCLIKNGVEIFYNGGLYIIGAGTVWLNYKRQPEVYFIEGYPNSLKFNVGNIIKKFRDLPDDLKLSAKNPDGTDLDVSMDSITLKSYKENITLDKISTDKSKGNNIVTILLIIVVIAVVVLGGLAVYKMYNPTPNTILMNATGL